MTPAHIVERELTAAGLLKSEWGVRIMEALLPEQFSDEDIKLASCWNTCACGEQDASLMTLKGPKDPELLRLGMRFYEAVEADDITEATAFLILIQRRATKLLAEQANK